MQAIYIKYFLFSLILISISAFYLFGIDGYFTVEYLRAIKTEIADYKIANPVLTATIFVLIYITGTSISLPVAGILSVTGGALFGLVWGTVLVSMAGTIGATISFILSRYLFRNFVQQKYGDSLTTINEGIRQNGNVYLLTMRLIPVIPYFIINPVMGITPMPVLTFALISMIGMVPVTGILVNGGAQIATINSIQDIMTFNVLLSFFLVGLVPLVAHSLSRRFKTDQGHK